MSEATFRNQDQLFDEDRFAKINEQPEWSSERVSEVRLRLEELLEKKEQLDEEMERPLTELETQYHWISAVLRALGFTFSVAELTPVDEPARPDFTLFYNADDFHSATPARGERDFFTHAIGLVRGFKWDASLDEYEQQDGPSSPAFEIDRSIRATGVDWGVLTNGQIWRLYHRDTSGLFSTFYEVNLMEALQSGDVEQFKYFWAIFSPEGLGGFEGQDAIVRRMLH